MTGQRAEGREQRIGAVDALRDGMRRVNRSPVIIACIFLLTLVSALPFSMVMRDELREQVWFGARRGAGVMAAGIGIGWLLYPLPL